MNRNWTNDTRKILQDAQCNAPQGLLSDIKKEMARRNLRPAYGKCQARLLGFRVGRGEAVAAVVAAAVILGVCFWPRANQEEQPIIGRLRLPDSSAQQEVRHLVSNANGLDASPLVATMTKVKAWMAGTDEAACGSERASHAVLSTAQLALADAGHMREQVVDGCHDSLSGQVSNVVRGKVVERSSVQRHTQQTSVENGLGDEMANRGSVQLSAHVSGMPSLNLDGVAGSQYLDYYVSAPFGYGLGDKNSSLAGIGHAQVPGGNAKHYQPVKVGVSVRVPLGNRWSLQTGLNYAYLKSDFKDAVNPHDIIGIQSLHYIGVPVGVSYDLWSTRRLHVYATAGGEVEKLVKGNYQCDSGDESVTEGRLLLSVGAAAGIGFSLSKSVGIYAEPGVNYHFKNGSGVESAYTDRPLGFSLTVGLRWNTT